MVFVASEKALLLESATTWQSTNPPRASPESRIAMRLLRETRRVLEYLSKGRCSQSCVYGIDKTIKRCWYLQLPEYVGPVDRMIKIFYQMRRAEITRRNEIVYIRAQIPVLLLYSTHQAQPKDAVAHGTTHRVQSDH